MSFYFIGLVKIFYKFYHFKFQVNHVNHLLGEFVFLLNNLISNNFWSEFKQSIHCE